MKKDDFGDRMKAYEVIETKHRLDKAFPIYARIDGRAFSKFTRGLQRPFDARISRCMIETAKHLVAETNADLGYTQSDEISLAWLPKEDPLSEFLFGGKVQKLCSVLSGMATAKFMGMIMQIAQEPGEEEFLKYASKLPHFDARIFCVPSVSEAANCFVWREMDAIRNAVSMTAHSLYSPKKLHGKSTADKRIMIREAGVVFDAFPIHFRRGTFVRRVAKETVLDVESLPEKAREHLGDDCVVIRKVVEEVEIPPLVNIANKADVLFFGIDPIFKE